MASDPLTIVRSQVALRVAEIRERGPHLSRLDLHARMDAIRQLAFDHGLPALEALARYSARLALVPGHRVAVQSCLERIDDALDTASSKDSAAILASVAARLHLRNPNEAGFVTEPCAHSPSCSTPWSTRDRATPSSS